MRQESLELSSISEKIIDTFFNLFNNKRLYYIINGLDNEEAFNNAIRETFKIFVNQGHIHPETFEEINKIMKEIINKQKTTYKIQIEYILKNKGIKQVLDATISEINSYGNKSIKKEQIKIVISRKLSENGFKTYCKNPRKNILKPSEREKIKEEICKIILEKTNKHIIK